ncbi:hypothetical protein J8TS2_07600 [Lederbergia ruris]|uniref:Uncharacterized protein n=1 Tax=Lederbergia ruris TaxID=217495 RepID=A0ABQ4KG45_9BACI|nr:hypothetical protein [Lederbergia ruris]GIN56441.1 hypothetical protein J8TS2_07600 [Lederbergia ruris]
MGSPDNELAFLMEGIYHLTKAFDSKGLVTVNDGLGDGNKVDSEEALLKRYQEITDY